MYIPGWLIFVLLIAGGLVAGGYFGRSRGDYDFFSPMIAMAIWTVTIVGGIAFLLGKYVF